MRTRSRTVDEFSRPGELVGALVDGIQSAGYRQIAWNASDRASGSYYYRHEATSIMEKEFVPL